MRAHGCVFALFFLLMTAPIGRADQDTLDMQRAVFVLLANSQQITFIDPDTDTVAGTIDAGTVPEQIALASSIGKLLVIDGKRARLTVIDEVSRTINTVALDIVPTRLTVSNDGLTAAVADPAAGRIVLVDLLRRQVMGAVGNLSRLHDMLFSVNNSALYVAGERQGEIEVIDATTARPAKAIATGLPHGSLALTRAPSGRRLFAQPDGGSGVAVLDLDHAAPLAPVPSGPGATVAFPSATGAYLLIADNARETLTIIPDRDGQLPVVLRAASGISTIYTAWFDTIALAPSATTRKVLLYGLDTLKPAGEITLAGVPGRGAVTPDGQKLYLPLPEAGQVAVVDAQHRRLVGSIHVPGIPTAVLMAGSYGVCH